MTTSQKYWWILGHPEFINKDYVDARIDVEPHDVCPITNRIEDYPALNTKTQYWIEMLTPFFDEDEGKFVRGHEYELDCGGDTYEEAIDNLYTKILEKYGDYTQEEAEAKYDAVHQRVVTKSAFPSSMFQPAELRNTWENSKLSEIELDYIPGDIENIKGTIKALKEFLKTCTIEEQEEANKHLQSEECKLWVLEESLRKGIDYNI
ncbi:TPA: hypothetical protein OGU99_000469 [Escherichia coli]|nr:hypothetical protein [Escherichia coli]